MLYPVRVPPGEVQDTVMRPATTVDATAVTPVGAVGSPKAVAVAVLECADSEPSVSAKALRAVM